MELGLQQSRLNTFCHGTIQPTPMIKITAYSSKKISRSFAEPAYVREVLET
jgi:hypothetical protein